MFNEYEEFLIDCARDDGYIDERKEPFKYRGWQDDFGEEFRDAIRQCITYKIVGMRSENHIIGIILMVKKKKNSQKTLYVVQKMVKNSKLFYIQIMIHLKHVMDT